MFVLPGLGASSWLRNNYLINPENGQHGVSGELDSPLLGLKVIEDPDLIAVLDFTFLSHITIKNSSISLPQCQVQRSPYPFR